MTPAALIEEAKDICRGMKEVVRGDRRFFRAHPDRHYWLRYASPAEAAARKYIERGAPVPPNAHVCVLVARTRPARLARFFIYMDVTVGPPVDSEEFGRECYEHAIRGMNRIAAVPQYDVAEMPLARAGRLH